MKLRILGGGHSSFLGPLLVGGVPKRGAECCRCLAAGFENGRRGPEPGKLRRAVLEAGNHKGMASPLECLEGIPRLSPGKPILDF